MISQMKSYATGSDLSIWPTLVTVYNKEHRHQHLLLYKKLAVYDGVYFEL